jgi:WD40 repeat protein
MALACSIAMSEDGEIGNKKSRSLAKRVVTVPVVQGGDVMSLAYLPNGRTLVATGSGKQVFFWETSRRKSTQVLRNITADLLISSPDGSALPAATADGRLRMWEPHRGRQFANLMLDDTRISVGATSSDRRYLVLGKPDGTVMVWDLVKRANINTINAHEHEIVSLAFSHAGDFFASADADNVVKVWKTSDGNLIRSFGRGRESHVWSLAFSPDDKLLAAGTGGRLSADAKRAFSVAAGDVSLWEVSTGNHIATLRGHINIVESLAFSTDGKLLASSDGTAAVKLWTVATGKEQATLQHSHPDTNQIQSLAFSPDGRYIATGSRDGAVTFWRLTDGNSSAAGTSEKERSSEPFHELRLGDLKAVITTKSTAQKTRYRITYFRLSRVDDDWKRCRNFTKDELPVVTKLTDKVHTWLLQNGQD